MNNCWALLGSLITLVLLPGCSAAAVDIAGSAPLVVTQVLDESGQGIDHAVLNQLRTAVADGLRTAGLPAIAQLHPRTATEVRPRLIQCPGPPRPAALVTPTGEGGCLGSVAVVERASGHISFEAVARTGPGEGLTQLGAAMAKAVARGLHPEPITVGAAADTITATGAPVRHLGDGRFIVDGAAIDLHAVAHSYVATRDPDVPTATNVTLNDTVSPHVDSNGRGYATITLYQVDPPLTGLPSREPAIDRGTDFRDPANLVKAAYTNYVSPVLTEDPVPVRVASHPIGHFFVKLEVPGYPTLLTGMTTIARADTELVDLTLGRQLGIGGVLLTPQPGRLNSSAEVARELALRQRRLRVVDGLYFHTVGGRNAGPEYLFEDGRVVFARIRLPVRNATDALAYFVESIHRGEQNRFGSLLNRPFKGTGAGCAAFAMSWLQAAGVIPFITEPAASPDPASTEALGPTQFWRAVHARLHIPWRLTGCDERVGLAGIQPAELTVYDLLFHAESADFIKQASEGLAARIRASYGVVPATLFQLGVLTPVRDLVIGARRKDPGDRADYSWSGAGLDVAYWDNSRFAAWIRRLWQKGPVDSHIKLAREGRFFGVEIDAMGAPRQREAFFAAADRLSAARAGSAQPAVSCQELFDRGLE